MYNKECRHEYTLMQNAIVLVFMGTMQVRGQSLYGRPPLHGVALLVSSCLLVYASAETAQAKMSGHS